MNHTFKRVYNIYKHMYNAYVLSRYIDRYVNKFTHIMIYRMQPLGQVFRHGCKEYEFWYRIKWKVSSDLFERIRKVKFFISSLSFYLFLFFVMFVYSYFTPIFTFIFTYILLIFYPYNYVQCISWVLEGGKV